jgi:hypothetical protein
MATNATSFEAYLRVPIGRNAASKTFRHPCFKKLASADLILFEAKAPDPSGGAMDDTF